MCEASDSSDTLDDLVDSFCYELAIVLRRVLDLDAQEDLDDEGTDD